MLLTRCAASELAVRRNARRDAVGLFSCWILPPLLRCWCWAEELASPIVSSPSGSSEVCRLLEAGRGCSLVAGVLAALPPAGQRNLLSSSSLLSWLL